MRDANGAMADAESELECCNSYHSGLNALFVPFRKKHGRTTKPETITRRTLYRRRHVGDGLKFWQVPIHKFINSFVFS